MYLLGYETIWYPDHAALTSLMNLKNPLGKLARWGMAVQEISLKIRYWPGRVNENADALSRAPVPSNEENLAGDEVEALMATPVLSVCKFPAKGSGEKENVDEICEMHPDLGSEQNDDPVLREIIEFESSGKLPENESRARYLALSKGRFTLICRHGVPNSLLSDRGPDFLSRLILSICDLLDMKKINTTAYHPQTDGMVERMNRTLLGMISKHVKFYGAEWDRYFAFLLFAYRVKPHPPRTNRRSSYCTGGTRDCPRKRPCAVRHQ